MAVILITHDLTVVRQFSDYVYVMQNGEVKEHNATEALFANPQHPYTQHLLASEPQGHGQSAAGRIPHSHSRRPRRPRLLHAASAAASSSRNSRSSSPSTVSSIKLQRHETLGLVGESGSGKTTFGQALVRLI